MACVVNTRADLDALSEPDRSVVMDVLKGSLWRMERDDVHQVWLAVPDDSAVVRLGLTRDDFGHPPAPELPVWVSVDGQGVSA